MLHPEVLQRLAKEIEEQHSGKLTLPRDISGSQVKKHLSTTFDETQFGAIAVRIIFHHASSYFRAA